MERKMNLLKLFFTVQLFTLPFYLLCMKESDINEILFPEGKNFNFYITHDDHRNYA